MCKSWTQRAQQVCVVSRGCNFFAKLQSTSHGLQRTPVWYLAWVIIPQIVCEESAAFACNKGICAVEGLLKSSSLLSRQQACSAIAPLCLSNHAAVICGNLRVLKVGTHGWGAAGSDCLCNGAVGETCQRTAR